MRFIVVLIIILNSIKLTAGIIPVSAGVKSISLANTVVSNTEHWALFGNPALMSYSDKSSIGISNTSKFGISDLNTFGFSSNLKTNEGHFGLAFSHYGIKEFNRQSFTFGFGRQFKNSHFGASGSYVLSKMSGDKAINALSINLGLGYDFSNDFSIAFSGINLNRAKVLDNPEERLETIFNLGTKLSLSKEIMLYSEIQYELDLERYIGKFGFEYQLSENYSFLSGISTERNVFNIGGIYTKDSFTAGIAFAYHQYLGISPSISISYSF